MNISKELLEKAKTAKTSEELLEMAKAENIELSAEQAAKAFAELNKNGELSDEELDNVAGGCGGSSANGPKYSVGDWVTVDINYGGYRPTCKVISVWREAPPYGYMYNLKGYVQRADGRKMDVFLTAISESSLW
ncbi:MAG: hypothetical protein ACI4MQ_06025 [Candidatus Coproplasma sp.]